MSASERLSLGRKQRLKQGRDFARVRQSGQRVVSGCLIANWLTLPPDSGSRLGVVVSRKVGNAVARSRTRRRVREAFRLHQNELLQPVDLVLVARPSIATREFAEVERDFLSALRKAGVMKPAA